jgi:hypothetical protein
VVSFFGSVSFLVLYQNHWEDSGGLFAVVFWSFPGRFCFVYVSIPHFERTICDSSVTLKRASCESVGPHLRLEVSFDVA